MKLRQTLALLLAATAFQTQAATELSPEKADHLKPFKEITLRGEYQRISKAAKAVSKAADKQGADAFYINHIGYHPNNAALWIVSAYLYHDDAQRIDPAESISENRYEGLIAYPKSHAVRLHPFERISVHGAYQTLNDMHHAIAKEAKKKGAYAFYIDQFYNTNGSNQRVYAYLYKEDAPERKLQVENSIPYDSEAGQAALAEGGERASQVEDPNAHSATTLDDHQPTRYTVTLPDETKIEELNNATAAKMTPFDSIRFRGTYRSLTAISYAAAKKAAKKGAKYYHITQMRDDKGNGNYTISINLYR